LKSFAECGILYRLDTQRYRSGDVCERRRGGRSEQKGAAAVDEDEHTLYARSESGTAKGHNGASPRLITQQTLDSF